MIDTQSLKDIIIAVICSGAFFSFIQFLITRWDTKKGLEKKIEEVKETTVQEVNDVRKDVGNVYDTLAEHKAILARTHILRFADEQRSGVITHSEEYFKQQILDIDTYNRYCEQHPEFANGLTRMASEYIQEEYRRLFLNGNSDD